VGAFEDLHRDRISGTLAMFDRMIFKGHLSRLYKQDGARCFLWSQGVALKDFTAYAKATTERIANNARKLAADAGRPVISFDHVKTRNRTQHKDELAKSIAERDGITEGIICLISAVESCFSFQVRRRNETGKLELFRRERKCLHHYLYLIDPEFGFMHVRIQGWIPMSARSTSTAGSGWPASSIATASATSATTTRCWPSMTSTLPPSCVSGSPTRPGPGSSTPLLDG
jgi:histone H3/H4